MNSGLRCLTFESQHEILQLLKLVQLACNINIMWNMNSFNDQILVMVMQSKLNFNCTKYLLPLFSYTGTIIVKYMILLPSNRISYLHKQTCKAIFLHQRYILHKRWCSSERRWMWHIVVISRNLLLPYISELMKDILHINGKTNLFP